MRRRQMKRRSRGMASGMYASGIVCDGTEDRWSGAGGVRDRINVRPDRAMCLQNVIGVRPEGARGRLDGFNAGRDGMIDRRVNFTHRRGWTVVRRRRMKRRSRGMACGMRASGIVGEETDGVRPPDVKET